MPRLQAEPDVEVTLYTDSARKDWREETEGLLIRWDTYLGETDFAKTPKLKLVVKQGVESAKWIEPSAVTIGIIGMGNIGREVARKWFYAMDAALVSYNPYLPENGWPELPHKRAQNLEELLTVSDVVSIHVPLTPETRGLIGRKELALMKNKSNLLNLARGGIVDEPALLEALKAEKFWGVGLDALNVEPLTIQVYHEFLESQRLIITPHVGGDTFETQVRSGIAAVDALLVALRGGEPKGRQA